MLAIVAQDAIDHMKKDLYGHEKIIFFINSHITDSGPHDSSSIVLGNILSAGHGFDTCKGEDRAPLNQAEMKVFNKYLKKYDLRIENDKRSEGWFFRFGLIHMLEIR